jgi:hypothetical protein
VVAEVEVVEIVVVLIFLKQEEIQDLLEEYQKELSLSLLEIIQYMLVVGEMLPVDITPEQIIVDLGLEITAEELLVMPVNLEVLEVVVQAVVFLECRNLLLQRLFFMLLLVVVVEVEVEVLLADLLVVAVLEVVLVPMYLVQHLDKMVQDEREIMVDLLVVVEDILDRVL